ncbi:hypothetical protein [Acinetobacter higginsii]|uniref:hypothetical protein n=1 Tax=Acinetobacter higginsii TaxID=70347 RepID=UPI001F624574|nr:hypothetical protein [Acinetobacter higginsii]MCI3879569.1 hypothetical protein [Acinetobacter higginsii]
MGKYVLTFESETPPQIFLNQTIPNIGKVVEMKAEELPPRVPVSFLMERFNFSRKIIIETLRPFNRGRDGKHMYDPKEVMPILENLNAQTLARQSRRKN